MVTAYIGEEKSLSNGRWLYFFPIKKGVLFYGRQKSEKSVKEEKDGRQGGLGADDYAGARANPENQKTKIKKQEGETI
ncbi:MAG: hypothetical protein RSC98_03470 [Clostridia bacterium]